MAKTHADAFFAKLPNIPLYKDCPNKSYEASLTADIIIGMARPSDSYHICVVPNAKYCVAITKSVEGKQVPVTMIYNGPRGKLIASSSGSILSNMYPHGLKTDPKFMDEVHGPSWRDVVQPAEWKMHHGLVVEEAFLGKAAITLSEYRKMGEVEKHNQLLKEYMKVHYECVKVVRGSESGLTLGKTVKKLGRSLPYALFGKEWDTKKLYHVAFLQAELYYHNPEFLQHVVEENYTFAELANFEKGEWGYNYEFQDINLETFDEIELEKMLEVVFGYAPEKYATLLEASKSDQETTELARKSFNFMVTENEIDCNENIHNKARWMEGVKGYPGNTHIQRVFVNRLKNADAASYQQMLLDFISSRKGFLMAKPILEPMEEGEIADEDLTISKKRKTSD